MKTTIFSILVFLLLAAPAKGIAQEFCVQLAAYSEHLPDSFFVERGIENYTEIVDKSGIFWYAAGNYATLEEAEAVQQAVVKKGFPYALIIDQEELRVLSAADCPYIRNGVVFLHDAQKDTATQIIYFDFGKSNLDAESKQTLDELSQKMQQYRNLTLKILGFTDGIGDAGENLKLAATRSRSARDYLIYKGIRADRMFMEVFGEAEPAAPNAEDDGSNAGKGRDLPENRKWNRRVTLRLETPENNQKKSETPK